MRIFKKLLKIGIIIFLILIALSLFVKKSAKNESKSVQTNLPVPLVWVATHEIGNLSEWKEGTSNNPSQDSGLCSRPKNGVSGEVAHTGKYSMKMSIQSWLPHSGCRQFRYPEIRTGKPYYYSAWLYFPEYYDVRGWSNIIQLKAKKNGKSGESDLFWSLRLMNRDNASMYFQLHWDQNNDLPGPTVDGKPKVGQYYNRSQLIVEPKKWTHVEMFVKPSSEFDGQIIVWQDGVEIYYLNNIRTKMPDGFNSWSVNSYGGYINPNPFTIYVDDVAISTTRLGPVDLPL